ncbi:MAG: hypothetical protein QM535_16425 [Limnohabitans sp.]|nr:hypothetical protein [Limnohabitans sp.]
MVEFDLDDCYTEEKVNFYRRKTNVNLVLLSVVFVILLFAFSSSKNTAIEQRVILVVLFLIGVLLYYSRNVHYYKSDEVLLTVSTEGVKYYRDGFVLWNDIENEEVKTIIVQYSDYEADEEFFVYYCKNNDCVVEINANTLNVSAYILLDVFRIFRSRALAIESET